MNAIPVVYRGIQYRSRVESRWAAWFDLIGWNAVYEPMDLGQWSPDFLIRTYGRPLLIEVKPVTEFDAETGRRMHWAVYDAGYKCDIVLLGISPLAAFIGWAVSPLADATAACVTDPVRSERLDIVVGGGDRGIVTGLRLGAGLSTSGAAGTVSAAWHGACNCVQYRPDS